MSDPKVTILYMDGLFCGLSLHPAWLNFQVTHPFRDDDVHLLHWKFHFFHLRPLDGGPSVGPRRPVVVGETTGRRVVAAGVDGTPKHMRVRDVFN